MDFGDYEGRIITKENESDPVFFKWLNSPREVTFPNGDNLLVHANKAFKQLKIIAREKKYNNVLIISHATTIRLIMSLLITESVDCFRNIPCNNGCISLLTTEDEKIKVEFINLPL